MSVQSMPSTSPRALTICLAASLLASGCLGALPMAPAHPVANAGFVALDQPATPGLAEDPARPFSLYPGDVVNLQLISGETSQAAGLTVDARGILHVPLAGDVQVSGRSLTDAEAQIEAAMHRYDATVRISIVMGDPLGHQATVIGAVGNQGRFPVVSGMRVADLVGAAGGLETASLGGVSASAADLHATRLIRAGARVPINMALAIAGDPHHNVRIEPGDHLYIPPQMRQLVSVIGEVNGARVFLHTEGLRLSQALALAGGITRDANGGDIRIVRGSGENRMIYRGAIDHVVYGDQPDPILAPGDVVYVGSSALADLRDVMTAISPIISIAATGGLGILAATVR